MFVHPVRPVLPSPENIAGGSKFLRGLLLAHNNEGYSVAEKAAKLGMNADYFRIVFLGNPRKCYEPSRTYYATKTPRQIVHDLIYIEGLFSEEDLMLQWYLKNTTPDEKFNLMLRLYYDHFCYYDSDDTFYRIFEEYYNPKEVVRPIPKRDPSVPCKKTVSFKPSAFEPSVVGSAFGRPTKVRALESSGV